MSKCLSDHAVDLKTPISQEKTCVKNKKSSLPVTHAPLLNSFHERAGTPAPIISADGRPRALFRPSDDDDDDHVIVDVCGERRIYFIYKLRRAVPPRQPAGRGVEGGFDVRQGFPGVVD